ncbi:Pr6Pr family membrane protein [Aeromicrobium sp.]|uniref:Pr6Pr family membrane protein n=1 Tax=Aeromicrobium sp. TaxID=1871063 RepID=UPI0030C437EA
MTRIWHGLVASLVAFALIGQTVQTVDRGNSLTNLFSYFTIESNLLVLVSCVLIAIRPDRESTAFQILRLGSLVAITVTGIVYATLLAGNGSFTGIEWWYDKIFHYVVPLMSVAGFLASPSRLRFDRRAMWFLVFPLVWLAYTLTRAEAVEPVFALTKDTTAPVPYGFLDVGEHGAIAVGVACVVLTAVFVLIAEAAIRISRR